MRSTAQFSNFQAQFPKTGKKCSSRSRIATGCATIWTRTHQNLKVLSASPKPHPSKPHPCNMPQAKTEVALQFLECCAAEVALQHSLFCSADVILTKPALQQAKNCTATLQKLRCRKVALSCRLQAPTFRHPRLGPAEPKHCNVYRRFLECNSKQIANACVWNRCVLCYKSLG